MQTVRLADTSGKIKDDYPTEITDYVDAKPLSMLKSFLVIFLCTLLKFDLEDFKSRIHSLNIPYENYQRRRAPRIVLVLGIMIFGGIIDCIVLTQINGGWERYAVVVISTIIILLSIIWLINYILRAKDEVANERERLINGFNSEDNSRDITWLFVKSSRTMCIRQPDHLIMELGRPPASRSLPFVHNILIEKGESEPYSPPAVHEKPGETRDVVGIVVPPCEQFLKQLEETTPCTIVSIEDFEESVVRRNAQRHWRRYINQTAVPAIKKGLRR
ncbi:9001_t:CDS:2 [Paraglomus occultum]|uniref:9001_t:CDS:1 n=1 Tax=Paraglomus occultum TaxID=144539 RepID=A0A9N9C9R7_9GLOM|nr:9001_t:CDS:2 [Paraglomus occultum]